MVSTSLFDSSGSAIGPDAATLRRRGRRTLALLAFVCVLPVAASYFTYYVWQPDGRVNYGELIPPTALPDTPLAGVAGPSFDRRELQGRWTLVFVGSGSCDALCARSLYAMRQSRLAQGEEMERVARVWLVSDGMAPRSELLAYQEGLRVAEATPAWLERLPGGATGSHIYLVDPLGNAMMRFPEDADPRRVITDLRRLLKYSALGRTRGER